MRLQNVGFSLLLILLLLGGGAGAGLAQVGITTDVLSGRVMNSSGEPLPDAVVSAVSLETGIRRTTLSDSRGRYMLIFPEPGGRYELEVSRLGMQTARLVAVRQAHEPVLTTDVRLVIGPIMLQGVTARAEMDRSPPGSQERVLDGEWLTLQPIDATELAAVASLQPGVLGLESTDSVGSGGFSVLGQRPDLNVVTVDGASFGSPRGTAGGGLGIPAEAVRLTRVITNSYDVSRGQFSGGQISTSTRGGTNRQQGTLTYSMHEPRLQLHVDGSPFNRAFTQHRLSGGGGGPIIRDRIFYFGSAAVQHRSQALQSLMDADAAGLEQLGAHPDSVARFLQILQQQQLSPREPVAASQQLIEELSLFGRLDFVLSDRHSLMMRGDARWNRRDGTQISTLGLPHSGGNNASDGGGVMVALTSRFRAEMVNEFRAYLSRQDTDAVPYFPVPEGRVRVASDLPDGSRSVSTLVFGGNRSLPVTSMERTLEMGNELVRPLGTRHRLKLGALLNLTRSAQEFSPIQYGSFTFRSLEDFATNQATSFSRSLATSTKEGGGLNAALYLGDTWQSSRDLQLTFGVRAEASQFGRQPDYNTVVDSLFGRRTDHFPYEVHVSPRLGFTYTPSASEPGQRPRATIRGGIGEFRGRPPFSLYSTAMDATGLPDGQIQIACVGTAVPLPDWTSFRQNEHHIPTVCADGQVPQQSSGRAPNVTVFAPDFAAPRSWRTSLGVEGRIHERLGISLEATRNTGTNLYGVTDLNLSATPHFVVAEGEGRPVFVDPATIVESSARLGMMDSRAHPEFGQVLEIHSGLGSVATQLSLGLQVNLPSRLALRPSYSASWVRDQSSFSCCSAGQGFGSPSTAGNPNTAEWGTSDYERRHALNVTMGVPLRPWAQLTLVGRANSGTPFTPIISGDINGDGARNDRALIFDPSASNDPAIAVGMARLLSRAPERIRACLERQLGRIAERNSCRGPWQTSLEVRTNLNPPMPWLGKRVTASIASQNLLTGLDQLFNGTSGLRGWGQRSSPDATLLYPRGFDRSTQRFTYELNERFGNPRQGRIPFGSPFQLHLEAKVNLGSQGR
ncbi:MAG: TonB-dependent receptor [Gemmatimonadetes bacterium]|nr:TonB-dependent receptor [Gemmatimonadota bacterium]